MFNGIIILPFLLVNERYLSFLTAVRFLFLHILTQKMGLLRHVLFVNPCPCIPYSGTRRRVAGYTTQITSANPSEKVSAGLRTIPDTSIASRGAVGRQCCGNRLILSRQKTLGGLFHRPAIPLLCIQRIKTG